MKVKVFEIVKSGLSPLSIEMESIIQDWLNENDQIKIISIEPILYDRLHFDT